MSRVTRFVRARRLVLLLAATTTLVGSRPLAQTGGPSKGVVHQLRIYELVEGQEKPFLDRFRDHAIRIMARYNFHIVATWESRRDGRTEFVYLLEWPNEETMKDQWTKFLADEEWIEIKRITREKHGALVGEIEDRTLTLTEFSPRRALAGTVSSKGLDASPGPRNQQIKTDPTTRRDMSYAGREILEERRPGAVSLRRGPSPRGGC